MEDHVKEFEEKGLVLFKGLLESQKEEISDWANDVPLVGEVVYEKGQITRCENFVDKHEGFEALTRGRMAEICGQLFGETEPAHLFKEKLNYKPPGGFGFMPHLDHPSLQFYAPDNFDAFITVMVAIDPMTLANGCLRLVPGPWNKVGCLCY